MGTVCEKRKFPWQWNWLYTENKQTVCGEKISGVQQKQKTHLGSTDFSSALNTCKTIEARSHAAMACFSRLIVNTAAAVTLEDRL